jgi:hypothetical protein
MPSGAGLDWIRSAASEDGVAVFRTELFVLLSLPLKQVQNITVLSTSFASV